MSFENPNLEHTQSPEKEILPEKKEIAPLEVFHETALRRIQELQDTEVYPKWYADERRDILTDFTPETQEQDGITAENAEKKALEYAEAVVKVFEDFRIKFDQKGREELERMEGKVFSTIDAGLEGEKIPPEAKEILKTCRAEMVDIRDSFIQYVVRVKKEVRVDEQSAEDLKMIIERLNALSAKVAEQLGGVKQFSIEDPAKSYEEKEKLDSLQESEIFNFLGKEAGENPINDVKDKVIERITEISDLVGSLETVSPEETANNFAKYYFPVIEAVRNATDYREVSKAFEKINPTDLTNRFYSIYKKKKFGLFHVSTQVGKGSFPTHSEEFKALLHARQSIILLAAIESDMEELE